MKSFGVAPAEFVPVGFCGSREGVRCLGVLPPSLPYTACMRDESIPGPVHLDGFSAVPASMHTQPSGAFRWS